MKARSLASKLIYALILSGFIHLSAVAEEITLNLNGVDIRTLIEMVSDVTGKNFVVDERVKGKVTVISKSPMDKKALYDTFVSILSVHKFTAIESGNVVKILPMALAKSSESGVNGFANGDEILTQIVEIKHITAAQLVPILRPLIPQQGHLAAHPENNMLIISDRAANIARLLKIIKRLDKADNQDVDVLMLEHASASEVVRIISSLKQTQGGVKSGNNNTSQAIADERTNSILISGEKAARLRLKALVAHLDTPLETVGNTQVIYLHYAKATDLVDILQGVSDSLQGKSSSVRQNMKGTKTTAATTQINTNIQADESTNSLIITAAPDVIQALKAVIAKLDIRRAQVAIEVIIAEIEINRAQELGVQWLAEGLSGSVGPVGLINFGSPAGGLLDLAAGIASNTISNTSNFNGATFGAGRYNKGGSLNFAVLLKALAADTNTNVLSTPSLVMLDNETAEIHVGQTVPFVTGQFTNTGASAGATNPFQTIQREDVGIKLKVTAQINEGNSIQLKIEQEVSNVVPDITAVGLVTNTRTIKTTVLVEDNNMVVLGGLIDESITDSQQKVPGLGDIPILGVLFRSQGVSKTKRNLMIFIHPRIIRDAATETKISHSKYNLMRARQLDYQSTGVPFTDAAEIPVLPDLNEFLADLPE